jgi:4-diphosphocytidyl-2-C-methyl-D-erythritol kinase
LCALRFGDSLDLTRTADGVITQTTPIAGVAPAQDLCVRAAQLLQQASGVPFGVNIAIRKRIPQGAGLGGGSSDAATVLLGLNRLWGCGLSRTALMTLGVQLGADVPFFIFGRAAFAKGIGDQFTAMSCPSLPVQLLLPDAHVPTPVIFKDPHLVRNDPPIPVLAMPINAGRNSLQAVAVSHYPAVATVLQTHPQARMSGSGAACFQFDLQSTSVHTVLTHLLPKHPLHGFCHDGE